MKGCVTQRAATVWIERGRLLSPASGRISTGREAKRRVGNLSSYVILAGIFLIWAILAYAGYIEIRPLFRKRKGNRRPQRSAARRR